MKTRKKYLRRIAFALAMVIGVTQFEPVMASTIRDANDKKDEAQDGLDAAQNIINNIENKQEELLNEIDRLDAELVDVILNLNILEEDLELKQEELIQVQEDLEVAQADEDKQYAAMKKRIRFMYERGDTALLTSLMESRTITDALNRVEYFNEVYDHDREMLISYQNVKMKVAELEVQVEGEVAELEEMQINYLDEKQRYETMLEEKRDQVSDFDTQLADARDLAEQYQATIAEQNAIIRQEEERIRREEEARANSNANNNSNGNNSNSGNSGSGSGSGDAGTSAPAPSDGDLNPEYSTGVSGSAVVNYACGFIGNPYVWGGTDPNTGADCSGFVQYVFRQFGVHLPRTSYEQRFAGKAVSYGNAQPGDIICYSGHVALYMGGGKIVHASSSAPYPVGGIKTGTATYRTIISVRRVL